MKQELLLHLFCWMCLIGSYLFMAGQAGSIIGKYLKKRMDDEIQNETKKADQN